MKYAIQENYNHKDEYIIWVKVSLRILERTLDFADINMR